MHVPSSIEPVEEDRWGTPPNLRPGPERAPLSFGQEALWFLSRLAPASRAYHLCGAARLLVPCDAKTGEAVARAFAALAKHHPALRTTFGEGPDGTPEQRVGSGPGLDFSQVVVASEVDLALHLARELDAPFDLEQGPLVRAGLITAAGETVLWLAAHHLVADFWSLAVMLRDVGVAYAHADGRQALLAAGDGEPQLSYAEWTRWQRERTAGAEGARELAAWKEALAGELPRLELPTDRPRRGKVTWDGGAVDICVAADAVRALGRVARGAKSNLFSALLAAFQAFLARLSGQNDLIVGTPTTGRFGTRVADQVGYFVNPVPVRADLSGDPKFAELLARQRPTIQAALALQAYPFSRLAEEIQPEREPGRSPIFDAVLAYEKARGGEGFWGFALGQAGTRVDLGGLALESLRVEPSGSPFDLSLAVSEVAGGLAGSLRYASELFDRATVERWAGWWVRLIEGAAVAPDLRLSELPLLSPSERTALLASGASGPSAGAALSGDRARLDSGFAQWEQQTPDALAVADAGEEWTYRELGERANRLAHHLRGWGVAEEARVAVCLDRSAALVAAMLGVLRAGAAFVPIDPAYPEARRAAMIELSGATAVVTSESFVGSWCGAASVVLLDALSGPESAPPSRRSHPDQLAYVIFTSGSTGTPKGVAISHRAALHMVSWYGTRFGWTPADRGSQIAGPGFDATVFEIWPALSTGASVHVPPDEARLSPAALLAWLAAERVTVAFLPTPLAEAAFAEPRAKDLALRYLTVGGDRLHRGAPNGFTLVNMYGPAENAVVSTAGEVPTDDPQPSIGRPIDGVRVYLLDRRQGLAPPGAVGELAAAGPGLARGYLGDPAQTAERFRPDPFGAPGERLYRTGDLARFRKADGEIDFLGRLDHQVKIRGQRIELGEIESALASLPEIREATVLVHEASPGDRRLVAFVVLTHEVTDADLIEPLRRRLSDAMVPRTFVRLERLPANANGKVDRRALAVLAARAVAEEGSGGIEGGTAPRSETELRVAAIWRELLGRERVGVEDDFFALGGHSLLVTQLASRMRRVFGVEFPLVELFAGATVASIAARVEQKLTEGGDVERIERVARPSDVPLSFSQERLWFVDRLEPGKATYNVGFRLTLEGPLSTTALEAALAAVVARHEPLRTRYAQPGDVARQEIDSPSLSLFVLWPRIDLTLDEQASAEEAVRIARSEGRRPFDLARGPVVRATLVKRGADLHDAIFTFHHIAIDGWSLSIFSREIAELYAAAAEGREAHLPDLPIEYADWAIWQRKWLSGERYERELSWWREHLQGAPEGIDLPTDRPRPSVPQRHAGQVRRTLPPHLSQALAARANAESSTPFMTLLAAWAGLLARLGSGNDLVIGTPIANRNRAETEGLIGFFVNSLALRIATEPAPTLRSLLATVRAASVGAFAHQDFPFERLVAELGGARGGIAGGVPPIYQVSFAFQNLPAPVMLPGLRTTVEELDGGSAKLDLGLVVTPFEEGFVAQLELNLDLFDPATGARLLAGFERMAAELAAHPEKLLADAVLLGSAERQQLLIEWRDGNLALAPLLAHDFIARNARERPEALALESEHEPGRRYTWAEVAAVTDVLARRLAGLGAGPEKVVGVSLERSVDRVLAMFAVWKAGACYLPVDPELPVERRALLLEDAGALVVMVRDVPSGDLGWIGTVAPLLVSKENGLPVDGGPEADPRRVLPENLAYLIYTSGSTGVPKGVGISHRHAAGHFAAAAGFYRLVSTDRVVQFASASFDVSLEQVGVALASGGTLVVRGPELPPPLELSAWMSRLRITNANLPTAVWTEWSWSEAPLPKGLRVLVTGGEAMTPAAADRFRQRLAEMDDPPVVYNGYGPTETVVTATCYDLRYGRLPESGSVSIGRLLPKRAGHVVDPEGRPQPLGGVGELVLGGLLARGYLDRPDLTAERFRPDPFTDASFGARLYWTGDRVRQRGDGSFDYLGRTDQQIKIRGFRIEPGEIEAALESHPEIREAIVLAREAPGASGIGKRLIAWARPHDSIPLPDLHRFLAGRLPDYMVPSAFVEVAEWPLTPTGKIDRRALPDPVFESSSTERIALRTATEEIVAGVFTELLGVAEIGAEADFFALGGHSLLATQLASRLRRTFWVELSLAELFAGATVAAIAERIDALAGGPSAPALKRRKASGEEGEGELSFAEERLWFLDRLDPGTATYNVGFQLTLDGPLSFAPFVAALSSIVARHARLRTRFGERAGKPFTTVEPPSAVPVPRIDLSAIESRAEAARLAANEGRRPFDLERGPLLRVTLLRRAPDRLDALFVFHHIATDGWSISVFSREMAELYAAAIEERPAGLPSLPIEVSDWAAWQRDWLSGEVYDRQLAWWRERLAGAPEVLDLPVDRPRPAAPKSPAWLVRRELPSAILSSVSARSRAAGATPFMVLLAAWAGLLSRLGAGRDLVIGAPIANRNRAETEGLIGFFINSLAMRISTEESTLHGLLARTREVALGAYAHQDFPFDRLVAELGGARGGKVPPLFSVSLVFQNLPEAVLLPGVTTTIEPLGGGVAKLDLALVVSPVREAGGGRLSALLEIDLDLFDPATGARLLAGFERMVAEMAAHPERLLRDAELLGRPERHQLLTEWGEGNLDLPPVLVHDWIGKHARERPDGLALESEHEPGRRYTWAEVAAHTDLLARRLAGLGAGPETVVGVSLERSVDRALAMFAIWKAGACYLPVDPELPEARRALLLKDAGAVVVMVRDLTAERDGWIGTVAPLLVSKESGRPVDFGPEAVPRRAVAENLAYIIYTSGSTGLPKGVGISHRHAAGHFAAACGFYRMDSTDRVVQFASASFDVSMEQVGVALASGGTLVVRGPELPPPLELSAWMTRWGITNANLPTAVWTEWSWSDAPLPRVLRNLVTGGEAMTPAAAERFRQRLTEMENPPVVYNGYGPTETVVTATCYDLRFGRLPESGSVSIGRLLPSRTGFVVDPEGRPQALGGIGELVLGGLLARGYLDRPDLTAERFRPNPLTDASFGARVYWTGDRVRQRGDGSFDYLGRTDSQIKIRGFRIEPGEIEAALGLHPGVKEAIVLAREAPGGSAIGKQLIAWYVARPEHPPSCPSPGSNPPPPRRKGPFADLKSFLGGRLPDYMVPSAFVEVSEWPLSPTGKIDRRSLPGPVFESGGGAERIALRTPTEEIVAGLFAELLGGSGIGADADFFLLGGHSLLATQLASRLRRAFGVEVPLGELFSGSTVAAIAARIDALIGRPHEALVPLVRSIRPAEIPLSFAQERLWFLDRLEPGTSTYNVGFRLMLEGPLDPAALAAALSALVARHEPLRTRFEVVLDRPIQRIDPAGAFPLANVDLARLEGGTAGAEAARLAKGEGRRPFDLERGPVLRSTWVRRGPERHDVLFVFHHIATDGWSIGVFSRELVALYGAAIESEPAVLPPLPIDYADWALWQRAWLSGEIYREQLSWWREQLAGAPEVLDLPLDRPRPSLPRRRAHTMRHALSAELRTAIGARSRTAGATPYMVLLAVWSGLLSRLGGSRDLVIGLPIANRNRAETEGLVGFFVNSLAIRISADAEAGKAPRLGDLLERARTAALGAYAHQDFPFDRLVAELGGSRGGGIPPVYQVALVLQNLAEPVLLPGLRTTVEELDGGLAKLDLALAVVPFHEAGADSFAALLELNLDLFDPATGARMLRGFEAMAREIAAHPDRLLAEAELLGRAERHQMLIEWRGGDRSPAPVLLQDWIARHALERPWDLALESEHEPGRRYTWSELAAHTDALARRLAALGAGPERVVGVSLERSVDRPLAMFAIWKAGACYLPVDPELPVERRALLLADANAVVLIAREEFFVDLPAEFSGRNGRLAPLLLGQENGLPVDLGPEAEPLRALPENLAYIIYTSGSTGTPKGVAISHRHAAGHFAAAAGFYQMDSTDRVVQFAAASFDVSMEQVGVALASGGTLVVRGPDLPLDLSAWMTRHKITNANLPTAVWTEWSRSEAPLPRDLRVLVTGGEAMTPAAAERFRSRLAEMENPPVVYNGYGPTETVVTATCYDLKVGRLPESGSVSIGRALPGRTALVVDAAGRLQTLGGIGELVLGGLIARGYFARPELTAERFRPDPFAERAGARIYWTGDRVRQRGDGSFDYLGRTDQQIKVRGFRIEPGEIEAALAQHRAVHDSIVLAREVPGAGPRLIAWYRPEEPRPENTENVSSAELRAHLAALLPDYMVPAAFVEVAEWPITPTGKIDRRALPGPQRTTGLERTPPGTSVQRLIADLWREALPELGEDLAIEDSFFELGGHSLLAVRITSKVAANFQVELPLKRLFEAPTIAGLEAAVLAAEARPGQSEKIAGVLLRMKSLSPEAKEKLLAGG